jgi:tetratricopeptide (TPR) repeat protein
LKLDPDNPRAKEFRDQAQTLLEQQVRPIYEEGVRLYNADELAPAMERFQRVLELHPDHADTRAFVARAIERVRSEAVELYKRAYIYEGLGRFREALELYEQALALLPDPKEEYHQKSSERIAELKRKL